MIRIACWGWGGAYPFHGPALQPAAGRRAEQIGKYADQKLDSCREFWSPNHMRLLCPADSIFREAVL